MRPHMWNERRVLTYIFNRQIYTQEDVKDDQGSGGYSLCSAQ